MKKKLFGMLALLIVLSMAFVSVTVFAAPEGESPEGEAVAAEGESADSEGEAPAEEQAVPAEGESAEGESAAEGTEGGDSAGGDSAGGDSAGAAPAEETGPGIVQLETEEMDELIIGAEGYEFTTDMKIGKLEIDPAAEVSSKYPIVVIFNKGHCGLLSGHRPIKV